MQINNEEGMGFLPTALVSRQKMAKDVPTVRQILKRENAEDLSEMILGGAA